MLKTNTNIYSNGLRFEYKAGKNSCKVNIYNAEGTLNYVDSFKLDYPLNTEQDLQVEVSFWLYDNHVI